MMTRKKHLSEKVTSTQNIALSPALKEYLNRYVRVQHEKFPKKEEYSKFSAFCRHVLENVLDMFERGKSFADFDRLVDKDVDELFEGMTFNATIPFYEIFLETNRYTYKEWSRWAHFFLILKKFYNKNLQPRNAKSLKITFERMKKYWVSNKIIKDARLELQNTQGSKHFDAIMEFIGKYRNLHYENCKLNAIIFGIIGIKVTNFFYSPTDLYARYDLTSTELFFSSEFDMKELENLVSQNINHLINFSYILDENHSFYLWMKLAQDKDVMLDFKDERTLQKWISTIETQILEYSSQQALPSKMAKFFEHSHWLTILNDAPLRFRFSRALSDLKAEIVQNYLKKWGTISKIDDVYEFSRYG